MTMLMFIYEDHSVDDVDVHMKMIVMLMFI